VVLDQVSLLKDFFLHICSYGQISEQISSHQIVDYTNKQGQDIPIFEAKRLFVLITEQQPVVQQALLQFLKLAPRLWIL
jgi:hypothetical protein